MSKFTLPADDRLETLIRESFEYIPGPDMRRLEQLEKRLARVGLPQSRRPVNTLPWWIVLLLVGGFATAAWWTGNIFTENTETDRQVENGAVTETEVVSVTPDGQDAGAQADQNDGVEYDQNRDTPVIYQRENF